MEKVKVDLKKEQQRSPEDLWLVRIMFSLRREHLNGMTTELLLSLLFLCKPGTVSTPKDVSA